ncbi:MAG: hypothetical protein JWM74_2926, partial [Myxococcaceae bacterium]|nr:hypothetical protein [Myxococcaceae bacterium]
MLHKGWLGFALVVSMLLIALAMIGCSADDVVTIVDPTIDAALPDGAPRDGSFVDATTDADAAVTDAVSDAPVSDALTDAAPPTFNVASAASTSSTRITVTFDAPPNPALAAVLANYSIPGLTLSGTPSLSGSTVSLTTSAQAAQPYTVTVSGVSRVSDGQSLTTKAATFTGRAPFNVGSAASTSAVTLTVTFSAPPNATQATALANYTVPGLTLSGVPVLSGNTVTLTTATQTATTYTLTVAAVTRASDGEPLTTSTANFAGTSSFNVASAAATDNTTVTVTFDAAPNATQAANITHYSIPGLTVSAASLTGNVVSLTTSAQASQSYTVTVSGVTRTSDGAPLAMSSATFAGRTTFNLVSAVSTSASSITVTFDAPPNGTQAIDTSKFAIPGLTLSAPVVSGITVKFTTSAQSATGYTLTVTGVTRAGDGQALTTNTATFTGRTPFNVTGAVANSVTLEITFDAPPNTAQATTLANYAVPGLTLTGTPSLAGNIVKIATSAQAAQSYTVTVSNVGRAGDGEALTVNTATFTGFPRALVQITEVAVSNAAADGFDFVELVAINGGRLDGLVVRESGGPLYTFGAFAVAAGDRIVVHAGGLCVPANNGCADEDATGMNIASSAEPFASATAWDVYSNSGGLSASDNAVSVRDGATIVDAVALSNRDGDTSGANMTLFAELNATAAWTFGAAPVDGTTDCATEKDTASVATAATACGGQPTANNGISLQRTLAADSNQKKDFYAAPQTRGAANGANPAPTVVSAVPTSATGVRVVFNEDVDPTSAVVASTYTIPALGVTSASLTDVNEV